MRCQLFVQFLIIQQSRPTLVPKLISTREYEIAVIPCCLQLMAHCLQRKARPHEHHKKCFCWTKRRQWYVRSNEVQWSSAQSCLDHQHYGSACRYEKTPRYGHNVSSKAGILEEDIKYVMTLWLLTFDYYAKDSLSFTKWLS